MENARMPPRGSTGHIYATKHHPDVYVLIAFRYKGCLGMRICYSKYHQEVVHLAKILGT